MAAVMRPAEARFSASTMTSSSIRLSLVGAQVDCRTKTSLPRTCSWISTLTLAVGKTADVGAPEIDVEALGDVGGQLGVGVAGEYHQAVVGHVRVPRVQLVRIGTE